MRLKGRCAIADNKAQGRRLSDVRKRTSTSELERRRMSWGQRRLPRRSRRTCAERPEQMGNCQGKQRARNGREGHEKSWTVYVRRCQACDYSLTPPRMYLRLHNKQTPKFSLARSFSWPSSVRTLGGRKRRFHTPHCFEDAQMLVSPTEDAGLLTAAAVRSSLG